MLVLDQEHWSFSFSFFTTQSFLLYDQCLTHPMVVMLSPTFSSFINYYSYSIRTHISVVLIF